MTSLVLKMFMSLDGFVAATDGSTDWAVAGRSEDGAHWTLDTLQGAGTHLLGAATYTEFAGYWPSASGPMAAAMNEIPKVVFSNTLTAGEWGPAEIVGGDLAEAVTRLKQERTGGYLLAQGGTRFARSLIATGLIDEYRLLVHPVVLGEGQALFTSPMDLEPVRTTAFSRGAVAHVLAPRSNS